ncbi:oligopeptide/dipeptide ABC transporter ATP-binding protein [Phytoactinopolyspora limicola]|uniref:oligopeptide/dipeptide ABC transporter ATP-binding protein n=1 Tax=Phytoactinopolyspora limicola TaxID=2715536 RepID=UPI003CCC9A58
MLLEPRHPYTSGLLRASMSIEQRWDRLAPIPGQVRQPRDLPTGCRFRDRCSRASDACVTRPALQTSGSRLLACHHPLPPSDQSSWTSEANEGTRRSANG